ncbi:hypothetical protein HanRHA438_Chr09g0425661 [Helianthus annuus]|nr:hypothetical protein HanRHA438_Chr09g0425661 [Helianthus annuus]
MHHLILYNLNMINSLLKNTASTTIINSQQTNSNMFRSNKLIPHSSRILNRSFKHPFRTIRKRHIRSRTRTRTINNSITPLLITLFILPNTPNRFTGSLDTNPTLKKPIRRPIFSDQTQQQMLRKHHIFP